MFLFPLNLGVSPCFHCSFSSCLQGVYFLSIIQLLVPVTGYIVPVCIMQVLLLVSVWTCGFNLLLDRNWWENAPFRSSRRHLVSGAMSYVCKMSVNPTNLVLCCEAVLAVWYHMFVCFLLVTSNFTVKMWRSKRNISWQIGFQTNIFDFINQPDVWWWK